MQKPIAHPPDGPVDLAQVIEWLFYFHESRDGFAAAQHKADGSSRTQFFRKTKQLEAHLADVTGKKDLKLIGKQGLTEFGNRLFERIEDPVKTLMEVARELKDIVRGDHVLRVGLSHFVAVHFMPDVAQALREERPDLRIQFKEVRGDEMFKCLQAGTIDLGVGATNIAGVRRPKNVRVVDAAARYAHKYQLIAHEKAGLEANDCGWVKLARRPWVMYREGTATRGAIEGAFKNAGISILDINVVAECGDEVVIENLVANNLGIAIIAIREGQYKPPPGVIQYDPPPIQPVELTLYASSAVQEEETFARVLWRHLR